MMMRMIMDVLADGKKGQLPTGSLAGWLSMDDGFE
jgi:hypothetical protein